MFWVTPTVLVVPGRLLSWMFYVCASLRFAKVVLGRRWLLHENCAFGGRPLRTLTTSETISLTSHQQHSTLAQVSWLLRRVVCVWLLRSRPSDSFVSLASQFQEWTLDRCVDAVAAGRTSLSGDGSFNCQKKSAARQAIGQAWPQQILFPTPA